MNFVARSAEDPGDCIARLFAEIIRPNGCISSAHLRDMEQRVQHKAPTLAGSAALRANIVKAWLDVVNVEGDAARQKYVRRSRLLVPDQARNLVAEKCEKWASVLYRVAEVQHIVYGHLPCFA